MRATRQFQRDKITKRTVRYAEQTDGVPPIVGHVYVSKEWLGSTGSPGTFYMPDTITVTIVAGEK